MCAFASLAMVVRSHVGFPLDDSWIHQQIARNLVQTHTLGFPQGQLSSGSTSVLWSFILAFGMICFPFLSQVSYCIALNAIFLFGIGYLLKRLTEEDHLPSKLAWAASIAPASSGNFLWFGLIGMEHLLFILLALLILHVFFSPSVRVQRRGRTAVFLCLLGALLVLTRPEGLFLILAVVLLKLDRQTFRQWMFLAAGALSGSCISAAVNLKTSGRLLPQTMRARQFLADTELGLDQWMEFAGQVYARCLKNWSITGSHQLLHGRGIVFGIFVGFVLAGFLALGVSSLIRARARRLAALGLWGLVVLALYLVVLPDTGHGGRYIALPMLVWISFSFVGAQRLLTIVFGNERLSSIAFISLTLILAVISIKVWREVAADGLDQINSEHAVMAEWLQHSPLTGDPEAPRLAVFDIGRIGYQLNGNIVDLGGLVDPAYLPFLLRGKTVQYLEQKGVRWIVLPTERESGDRFFAQRLSLDPSHGILLQELHSVCADEKKARLAMMATSAARPCQTAYSVRYLNRP